MRAFIIGTIVSVASGGTSFHATARGEAADAGTGEVGDGGVHLDGAGVVRPDAGAGDSDGSTTPGNRYVDAVTADAPVGWWRLEETSGPTAKDSSGKGHDATIVGAGGVAFGTPGALSSGERAFALDGAAALVIGDVFDFTSPASFTIEAWVKTSETDNVFRRIFSKIAITGSGPEAGSYLFYNGNVPRVGFEGWSGGPWFKSSAPTRPSRRRRSPISPWSTTET